ncbi:MAG: NUDIX hydrolase [Pseudonocardiaceae bacterium]
MRVYPNRNAVARQVWDRLLGQATSRVDVLIYVGMFLTENPAFVPALRAKGGNGCWIRTIPGGAQNIGEPCTEAAVREVHEETGLGVEITGLVGIYSDPRHVIAYDDGEVRQEFSVCFHARPIGGQLMPSSESKQVHWVEPEHLANLAIHSSVRLRIEHGLQGRPEPYLG